MKMNSTLKQLLLVSSLSLAASLSATAVQADEKDKKPSFSKVTVTDNISMLQGKGGNIGILKGDDGLLMIDDDYQDMSKALKKALRKLGGAKKVAYLINTHWHGDHTGGNFMMGDYTTIVAHDNVRARLLTAQEIKLFGMKSDPYPAHALPSITYQSTLNLYINDEEVQLVHFAGGHTDGDSVVFFKKANVVHMGDHFFNGIFPFIDIGTGGSAVRMAENVAKVLTMIDNETKVIPGHGPLANKKDLKAFHAMLVGTTAEVKAMKNKGLTIEQAKKQGLSKAWEKWSSFINTETWIGIVYQSL